MAKKNKFPVVNPGLTIEELKSTHELHRAFRGEWDFLYAAYGGARELINLGYLVKNERETVENYRNRKKQAYGFNYTQSIVDTLNFYLTKKPPKRDFPDKVSNDELYKQFEDDTNLEGDNMDIYLAEISRLASIMGMTGVLVDKSGEELLTRRDQIDNKVYAYLVTYFPQAILDWEMERNEFGRPTLVYVKLQNDDGRYTMWFRDHFEIWEVSKNEDGSEKGSQEKADLIESSSYDLGEIPFFFVVNKKWKKWPIGKSDVSDVARIDVSIIRNLSQGEEIIDYTAFPMMRKPMLEGRPDQQVSKVDDVGPTAVLEFDPDNPDSKPDWLESKSEGPLKAIIDWIKNKVSEIYRGSNIGGMAATEVQTQAKSGVALQTEFQMLNSALVRKAITLEKLELSIYRIWYKWEYGEIEAKKYHEETVVERDRTYDVENLAQDLDNILTAKTIVLSKTFNEAMQMKTARMMLPSWNDSQLSDIDQEIEESVEEKEENNNVGYQPFEDDEEVAGDDSE